MNKGNGNLYRSFRGIMNNTVLNEYYGESGMVFQTELEATNHASKYRGAYIYTLKDYLRDDIERIYDYIGTKAVVRARPVEGAQKYVSGYLVQTIGCKKK